MMIDRDIHIHDKCTDSTWFEYSMKMPSHICRTEDLARFKGKLLGLYNMLTGTEADLRKVGSC